MEIMYGIYFPWLSETHILGNFTKPTFNISDSDNVAQPMHEKGYWERWFVSCLKNEQIEVCIMSIFNDHTP